MKIQLDENWSIGSDSYSWVLNFAEKRIRTNQKTETEEEFLFENNYWYPKLSDCLKKYKEEALKPLETVEQLLSKLESIDKKIGEIKNDIWKKL
jgi:hypothetical protein